MKKRIFSLITAVAICICFSIPAMAAATGSKSIGSYGTLKGKTDAYKNGNERMAIVTANTTNVVPKIKTALEICVKSTGKSVSNQKFQWQTKLKYFACEWEAHHTYNPVTKSYDSFKDTKITAYGASEVYTSKSYVVYTNKSY